MYKETVKSNMVKGIREEKHQTRNIKLSTQRHRNKISKATGHSTDQCKIKNKGGKLHKSRYMSHF